MDCSLPGSSIHGIFQARVLEWVAISFSRGSSQPRDRTPGLLHCKQTLYRLSHQGSQVWVLLLLFPFDRLRNLLRPHNSGVLGPGLYMANISRHSHSHCSSPGRLKLKRFYSKSEVGRMMMCSVFHSSLMGKSKSTFFFNFYFFSQ